MRENIRIIIKIKYKKKRFSTKFEQTTNLYIKRCFVYFIFKLITKIMVLLGKSFITKAYILVNRVKTQF